MTKLSRIIVASSFLFVAQPAGAGCIERMQDFPGDPGIADFIARIGSVNAIPGAWVGHGHRIEFHIFEDRIQSRLDSSGLADIRICSTKREGELKIETLNSDGTVAETSKIRIGENGSIAISSRQTPLRAFIGGFRRRESFEVPRVVLASVREVQLAAATSATANN